MAERFCNALHPVQRYGPKKHPRSAASDQREIVAIGHPRGLPAEQPTAHEFTINLKTAKALGIKIPNLILVRADKVIE